MGYRKIDFMLGASAIAFLRNIKTLLYLLWFTCSIGKFTYSYKRRAAVIYYFMSVKCSSNPQMIYPCDVKIAFRTFRVSLSTAYL